MAENINFNNVDNQEEGGINLIEWFFKCLNKWHWFVISVVACLAVAYVYTRYQTPQYNISASVLIKDDSNSRSNSNNAFTAFSDNLRSNAEEELKAMRSPAIMTEAIKRLDLDITYTIEGKFHNPVIYGTELPARVKLLDLGRNDDVHFIMNLQDDSTLCMWGFEKNGKNVDSFVRATNGETVESPVGRITANFTEYSHNNRNRNITVTRTISLFQ